MRHLYKGILFLAICGMCFSFSATFAKDWILPGVKIIKRADRGANEKLRYSTQPQYEVKAQLEKKNIEELESLAQTNVDTYLERKRQEYEKTMANDYLISNYATEQTVDEIRYQYLGNYLKWPEAIHKNKVKIIVHHTAGDYTSLLTGGTGAVIKYMQDVYKYHTITRGRGDIGYNFLIDPFGNIYEGRAGGEGVIAAHTSWNNTPSIGISLMGNFDIQEPTAKQLQSLIKLTTALAKKYKINPESKLVYFEKDNEPPYVLEEKNFTIAGHKDAGNTSCPGTNLYALLPDLRAKVKKGLSKIKLTSATTSASGSTATNTGSTKPVDMGTTIAGIYYSDKKTDTFLLPMVFDKLESCASTDGSMKVNACSIQGKNLQINLTKNKFASGIRTFTIKADGKDKNISFKIFWQEDVDVLTTTLKDNYIKYRMLASPDGTTSKITAKLAIEDVKKYLAGNIKVLLYDLSKNYSRREMSCDGKCIVQTDTKTYTTANPIIESFEGFLYLTIGEDMSNPAKITISAATSGGLVTFSNYTRASYAKIPRNTYRGKIIFQKDQIKNLKSGTYDQKYVVINELPFGDYLKGIGETSETDNEEKITLMSLLAKTYALFYISGKNKHPSIPVGATYNAVDSPDMFQKYIGAGAEKTFPIYQRLLESTKNKILLYDGYVPILPYFSCSAGFTFSAQEKRGRSDTPYLQSRIDFEKCADFAGHGVGLSGKGAQYLATQGRSYEKILAYYYPGVKITSLK